MKQQVNLYTQEFRPQIHWFGLNQLVVTSLLVLVVILLIGAGVRMQLSGLESRQGFLEKEQAQLQTLVRALRQSVEDRDGDVSPVEQVEGLEREVRQRRDLVARADSLVRATETGFAKYLVALAEHSDESLWLTGIQVDLIRDSVRLEGMTQGGNDVPRYLHRLREAREFEGRRFADFGLNREDPDGPLTFLLFSSGHGHSGGGS